MSTNDAQFILIEGPLWTIISIIISRRKFCNDETTTRFTMVGWIGPNRAAVIASLNPGNKRKKACLRRRPAFVYSFFKIHFPFAACAG